MEKHTDETSDMKKTVEGVVDSAGESARDLKTAGTERARELKTSAKETAEEVLAKGKSKARSQVNAAQSRAAAETEATAEAMRRAGDRFDEGDFRQKAAYHLADGIGSVADRIGSKSLQEIPDDLRRVARQNPALFIAGAALTGFALARLVKASTRPHEADIDDDDDLYLPARPTPSAPALETRNVERLNGTADQ